jgi:RNA-directed DNA polymerase
VKTNQHILERSPLYRVKSIHQLAKVLLMEVKDLRTLEHSVLNEQDKYYRVFMIHEGTREVQHPFELHIARIQKRVKYLLALIQPPEYLQSGRRGISYVDNAKLHQESSVVWTMDIRGFYKNTRDEAVYQFFIHKMGMADDLAHIMTNLCTFKDEKTCRRKIPTGSTLSQQLAYWAYSDMFNRINDLAVLVGAKFSLYVDDMTFSSDARLPENFHKQVQELLASRWLTFKPTKVKRATENQRKHITGCAITREHSIVAPNRLKKKAVEAIGKTLCSGIPTELEIQQAMGLVQSCRQIEPEMFDMSFRQLKAKRKAMATIITSS